MKEIYKRISLRIVMHSFSTALLSALACYFYATFYYSLLVDFSEGSSKGIIFIVFLKNCFFAAGIMSMIHYLLKWILHKKEILADLLSGLFFSIATIASVFYVLKMKDPVFKTPDAQLFVDFYKGFLMPILFFPLLAWFTLKPLFLLKTVSENE